MDVRSLTFSCTVAVLCVSCGSDRGDETPWELAEADHNGEPTGDSRSCQTNEDCGEDAYCHEPSDCDAPKYCMDGFEPWSAAPPALACSCGGQITSVNAGYPGRHAWATYDWFSTEQVAPACDPDAEFPRPFRVTYQLPDVLPDNLLARVTGPETFVGEPVAPDQTVTVEIEGGPSPDFRLHLLHDANLDGECSPDEELFRTSVERMQIDFEQFTVQATAELLTTTDGCDSW